MRTSLRPSEKNDRNTGKKYGEKKSAAEEMARGIDLQILKEIAIREGDIPEKEKDNIAKAKEALQFVNKLLSGEFSFGGILGRTKYYILFDGFINYIGVFPTISRKIYEIVNKKVSNEKTKLAKLKGLDQVLAHIDFNRMLLRETSDNIKAVLNSVKQGWGKESTQDLSRLLRMGMLKIEISWAGLLRNYAFDGVHFYLMTLRDLLWYSLLNSQNYLFSLNQFCGNYERLQKH
jgi:hypothetical protein